MDRLTETIKVSLKTKGYLDMMKGRDTYNKCIEDMIVFFQETGHNPKNHSKNPNARVEKRIEDVIKIIRSFEKDYFIPVLNGKVSNASNANNSQLINLANDNNSLKKELIESKKKEQEYKDKLSMLINQINAFCNNANSFKKINSTSEIIVPPSTFKVLMEQINKDYVL